MKTSFPFYWITAILYSLFIFFLAVFALPAAQFFFGGDAFFHRAFPYLLFTAALTLASALWKYRRRMSPLKWGGLALLFLVYGILYFTLDTAIEEIHLINFSILTLLFEKALQGSLGPRRAFLKASALSLAVGVLDEVIQKFVPGRYSQWHDIGLCVLGVLSGCLLAWVFTEKEKSLP